MNLFYDLPIELQNYIFEFDNTKRDNYKLVIEEYKQIRYYLFEGYYPNWLDERFEYQCLIVNLLPDRLKCITRLIKSIFTEKTIKRLRQDDKQLFLQCNYNHDRYCMLCDIVIPNYNINEKLKKHLQTKRHIKNKNKKKIKFNIERQHKILENALLFNQWYYTFE